MIKVRLKMLVDSKNKGEVLNTVRNLSQEIRKEDGCINNIVFQNLEDESEILMLETWKTKTLLKRHWKTFNFSALMGIQTLLKQQIDIEISKVTIPQGLKEIEDSRGYKKIMDLSTKLKVGT